jgi:hypothetical protein
MRRIYIWLLVCFCCSQLTYAQEDISPSFFQVDSLPKDGLLLNQGWKWQEGDNLAWANASFNDKQWQMLILQRML